MRDLPNSGAKNPLSMLFFENLDLEKTTYARASLVYLIDSVRNYSEKLINGLSEPSINIESSHMILGNNATYQLSILENDSYNYAVKVVAYPKKENYGDMYNIKRPENTELLMIRLLSYFVINKQTPHIVLPITTFNTSIKPFLNLTKSNIVNNKKFYFLICFQLFQHSLNIHQRQM